MLHLFFSYCVVVCSDRSCKAILPQIANQILQKDPKELRCHSRAWKVNLIGEGADDAGGVFDESLAQMCEVRHMRKMYFLCISYLSF